MNHELPDERLSAYLDGELTAEETERLEAELDADPALRAELDRLNAVVSFLADEGPLRAPLGFHHAVMERVDREFPEAANTPWWAWVRRPFGMPIEGVAVAAVALWVLAVVGLPGSEAPDNDLPNPEWRDVPPDPEAAPAPAALKLRQEDPPAPAEPVPSEGKKPVAKPLPTPAPAPRPDLAAEAEAVEEPPVPAPAPPLRSVPNGYDVFTEDVTAFRSLLALVGRLGGEVTDLQGRPVTDAEMSSSRRDVKITLPQAALNEFQSQIQKLGIARPYFDDDRLLSSATVELQVGIQLSGGGVGTSEGGKRRSERPAKQRMQLDELAEPAPTGSND